MSDQKNHNDNKTTRRDFIVLTASAMAGLGAVGIAWPLISSLNPSADVLALSSVEVNLEHVQPGQSITVMWRGKPIVIRHRTPEEIKAAEEVNVSSLRDPQMDSERVKLGKEQWLVMVKICTHLGCVPLDEQGDYNGWFCPCHGSHYDTSGRIRKGPAPQNLLVPEYAFVNDNIIKIG
ncbi:ubiquinol-cytochrome c reductase iron-sulfur subunit [Rickettsiales endosymbiont of Stachyamoeba lipophora]|uniref:ubiquinol-cytochrome c reductase iron-sulfur subunit n=1 Tax=Rickettsiales endosymbiont of Stachyamoeba lipophora TaxID=2486578 RepID=UPI000F64D3D0|nr:ubiquinol-cytochrome c reductase iron-sulfur subunit [Rickettsiales endosymbiont of Stachyamoeba lipophora]AZL15397.1 ubiquinol-cytochrome c reductase iron-sulfur subunit [Rickettsiales endosymbiont of Stachyamoeba lipophora]